MTDNDRRPTFASLGGETVFDKDNRDEKHYGESETPKVYISEESSEHEVGLDLYRKAEGMEYTPEEEKRV